MSIFRTATRALLPLAFVFCVLLLVNSQLVPSEPPTPEFAVGPEFPEEPVPSDSEPEPEPEPPEPTPEPTPEPSPEDLQPKAVAAHEPWVPAPADGAPAQTEQSDQPSPTPSKLPSGEQPKIAKESAVEPGAKAAEDVEEAVQKPASEPSTPAPPVDVERAGLDSYDVRFSSDMAMAATLRRARMRAYACSPSGKLFLVSPGYKDKKGGATFVGVTCSPQIMTKMRLRPLERPTAGLLEPLGLPEKAAGRYQWFVRLDSSIDRRVRELRSELEGQPEVLVEIEADGSVRLAARRGQ